MNYGATILQMAKGLTPESAIIEAARNSLQRQGPYLAASDEDNNSTEKTEVALRAVLDKLRSQRWNSDFLNIEVAPLLWAADAVLQRGGMNASPIDEEYAYLWDEDTRNPFWRERAHREN